jgi:hypothetical protein
LSPLTTLFEYDSLGRRFRTIHPGLAEETVQYIAPGVTTRIDRWGKPWVSARSADGRYSAQYGDQGILIASNVTTYADNQVSVVATGPDGLVTSNQVFHALKTAAEIYGPHLLEVEPPGETGGLLGWTNNGQRQLELAGDDN